MGVCCFVRGSQLGISTSSWGPRFPASRDYDKLLTNYIPSLRRADAGLPPVSSLTSPPYTPGITPGVTPGVTPGGSRFMATPATGLSMITPVPMMSPTMTPGSSGGGGGGGAASATVLANGMGSGGVYYGGQHRDGSSSHPPSPKRQCVG